MKLIVGLGNPGAQYLGTRHNVGYEVVDVLAHRFAPGAVPRSKFHALTIKTSLPSSDGPDEPCVLMKPMTFMNRSGQSVAEAVRFYKLRPSAELLVIVDDINLSIGTIRVRAEGGAGGHNGLVSIQQMLGSPQYARLRIGIDEPGHLPQSDYVLGKFTDEQRASIDPVIRRAADAAECWVRSGPNAVMNQFNTRVNADQGPDRDSEPDQNVRSSDQEHTHAARQPSAPNQGEASQQ